MKKFRLLAAMVITIAMIFTVAFAADATFKAIEYDGSAETVEVVLNMSKGCTIDQFSALCVSYDTDVFAYASGSSSYATATVKNYGSYIGWSNDDANATVASGDAILTLVFNVLDKDAVVGSTFAIDMDNTMVFETGADMLDFSGSVTVTSAAPAKTPAAVEAGTAAFQTITGASGQVYNNVWVNKYTAKANDDTITAVKLAFNGKTVTVSDVEIEAGGTVEFDVAIVGAALEAEVTPSVTVK